MKASRIILLDHPEEDDQFSGGGHRKTANALAAAISQFGGQTRSIGLEGRWGAGKSTIVNIAEKILATSDSHHKYDVFTFDLWTNQNTDFRRTFLESLLDWLKPETKDETKFIRNMRDLIQNRTVVTETVHRRVFTTFGYVAVAFLVALPLLYMWLTPSAFSEHKPFSVAALLICLAMAVFTAISIIRTKKGLRVSWSEAFSRTISLFTKDAQTVNLKQNIREADPTQNEFGRTLRTILKNFQDDSKRIVVVLDNIDRLPSDQILESWSNIRSVLMPGFNAREQDTNIIVIVPYDREHVLGALKSSIHTDAGQKKDTEDFFRKSFDIVFNAPPPILSDSKDYFLNKLESATRGQQDTETAFRLFQLFTLSLSDSPPTPRQVIAFINATLTIWEQWKNKVPLLTAAIYGIHRDEIEKNPEFLTNTDAIDLRYREISGDPELDKNLAALAFNVEPQFALQVLLRGKIQSTLTAADRSSVIELSNAPGFDIILPQVTAQESTKWATSSPSQLINAMAGLATIHSEGASVNQSKQHLIRASEQLQETSPESWEKFTHAGDFYKLCNSEEAQLLTSHLVQWLRRSLPTETTEHSFKYGTKWIQFVGALLGRIREHFTDEVAEAIGREIEIPDGPEFLVGAAYYADAKDVAVNLKALAPIKANRDALATSLERRLTASPHVFHDALRELHHTLDESALSRFLEKLSQHLSTEPLPESSDILKNLLASMNLLHELTSDHPAAKKQRQRILDSGVLYFLANREGDSNEEVEIRARALLGILDFMASPNISAAHPQHPNLGSLQNEKQRTEKLVSEGNIDPETLEVLAELSVSGSRLTRLVGIAGDWNLTSGLLSEVISKSVLEYEDGTLSPGTVASNFEPLREMFNGDLSTLLAETGAYPSFEDEEGLEPEKLEPNFIREISGRTEPAWVRVNRLLDDWLTSVESDAWTVYLSAGDPVLELLRIRVKDGQLAIQPAKFREPLIRRVIAIFTEEADQLAGGDDLVLALPTNTRRGFARDILDQISTLPVSVSGFENALKSTPSLLDKLPFSEAPETSVRKIILPAVQSDSSASVAFVERHGSEFKEVMALVKESLRAEVGESIKQADEDDADQPSFESRLRRALGLGSRASDKAKS